MNEITRIHLARVAYDIELGAKKELDGYLKDIKTALKNDETLMEVEQRMSEILLERGVKPGSVITAADIKVIRAQLGEPKDFGEEEDEIALERPASRRLMRDIENKMIAGVGSGLAAHIGTDPTVVRLIFIVLTFFNGLGLLLYLVLWAIMPPARTLSDRLSLRGQTATIDAYRDYDGKAITSEIPSWMLAFGRWVLGLGLLFVGWLPVVMGTIGTVVTFRHQNDTMFPISTLDWVSIVAAWVGALAFSVFMTTLGLAALRWNAARIKWPLLISGVVGLLAALTIATVGPLAAQELRERNCTQTYHPDGQVMQEVCQAHKLDLKSL